MQESVLPTGPPHAILDERPTWLALAHERLDRAVLATYGWLEGLGDEEVLERLLALNLERAATRQS